MNWFTFALLSAFFASLTAILAKIGIKDVNSNLATAIRTVVILLFAWGIVMFQGTWKQIGSIPKFSLIFLVLSGLATGMSWLFYFRALQLGSASQVAPVDKLSLALTVILAIIFLHEKSDRIHTSWKCSYVNRHLFNSFRKILTCNLKSLHSFLVVII